MKECMKKSNCSGCYNNDYNFGLGGSKECWSFKTATLKLRKRVSVDQPPPWKQKAEWYPSCYQQSRYVFVDKDRER